jgi:hypothetical protein
MPERLPTNDVDPEPGDFDAELVDLDPREVHRSEGDPAARLSLEVTVHGDDADKLRQIAHTRGQRPSDVVADLLRSA